MTFYAKRKAGFHNMRPERAYALSRRGTRTVVALANDYAHTYAPFIGVQHDAAKAEDPVDSTGIVVKILGIVTRTHDSGLALLDDGVPTIVLEEERFNREKHTRKFPF